MWICPTKNQDEFYSIDKIIELLENNFPQYGFKFGGDRGIGGTEFNPYYITVNNIGKNSKENTLHKSFFIMECYIPCPYLENRSETIDDLDGIGKEDLADKLIRYTEEGADVSRCIEIRHSIYQEELRSVYNWMRWYFQAIIFDEGIHPEFILPLKDKPIEISKISNWSLFKKTFEKSEEYIKESKYLDYYPEEITINQFIEAISIHTIDGHILDFSKRNISSILELKQYLNDNRYEIQTTNKSIHVIDTDINRVCINTNYHGSNFETAKGCGNFEDMWIYKLEDEWFLISLQRSNIIPYHKNPHYLRTARHGFKFFKADQIEEVLGFLETLT